MRSAESAGAALQRAGPGSIAFARLDRLARPHHRNPRRHPGRGRDPGAAGGRDLALRVQSAADLVGRARLHPVPVAGDAGRRHCAAAQRAHAARLPGVARSPAAARLHRDPRDRDGAGLSPRHHVAGARLCGVPANDHHAGAGDPGRLPGRRHRGRRRPDAAHRHGAPDRARRRRPDRDRGRHRGRGGGRAVARRTRPAGDRKLQSGDLLRRAGRHPGGARGADRLCVRARDARLSGLHDPNPAHHRDQPHGCRHVRPHPPGGAAVRVPGPDDGDGGAGARAGRFHRRAAGPCPRRARLCAARRHVSGLRHLRLEGRRHGGCRPRPVPGDEAARRAAGRAGGAAGGFRRHVGDHPAEPGADHHRVGRQCLDPGPVHRRAAARPGGRPGAGRDLSLPLARRRCELASSARPGARLQQASWWRCRRWRCRS